MVITESRIANWLMSFSSRPKDKPVLRRYIRRLKLKLDDLHVVPTTGQGLREGRRRDGKGPAAQLTSHQFSGRLVARVGRASDQTRDQIARGRPHLDLKPL